MYPHRCHDKCNLSRVRVVRHMVQDFLLLFSHLERTFYDDPVGPVSEVKLPLSISKAMIPSRLLVMKLLEVIEDVEPFVRWHISGPMRKSEVYQIVLSLARQREMNVQRVNSTLEESSIVDIPIVACRKNVKHKLKSHTANTFYVGSPFRPMKWIRSFHGRTALICVLSIAPMQSLNSGCLFKSGWCRFNPSL